MAASSSLEFYIIIIIIVTVSVLNWYRQSFASSRLLPWFIVEVVCYGLFYSTIRETICSASVLHLEMLCSFATVYNDRTKV